MASNAVIGALRVVLGADSAALETGLKEAQGKLAAFGTSVAKAGAAAAAAFAVAGAAVAVAVKGAIDEADKLGKSAQKWGVPIEELSRLKHAADLSGVGFEELGKAVGKLSKNMSEVAGGATNTAAHAFTALGISVKNTDGSLKSSSQVMAELAGKFERFEDGAGKTALAIALFGKAGADMIPLLNSGAAGMRNLMNEADQLGIVIDEKTAKAAEAFNDNLTRLGKVKDGIILKITAGLVPSLERLSEQMLATANDSNALTQISNFVNSSFKFVTEAGVALTAVIRSIGIEINGLVAAARLIAGGEFTKAWEAWTSAAQASQQKLDETRTFIATMWDKTAAEVEAKAPEIAKKIAAPIIQTGEEAKKAAEAVKNFIDGQLKAQAATKSEIATIGMAAGARERLRIVMQAEALEKQNGIALSEQERIKIMEMANSAEISAQKLKAAQLIQQNRAPHEQFRSEIENNKIVLETFGATAERIAEVQRRTAEKYAATWYQAGESIAGSIADIGNAFGKENKSMAMVAKAAGIVQATISMFVGAAKALELPFPANLAAWAAVIAKGAAMVASIRSVNVGGFAAGGSFRVPGGLGGGDRMRAMVDLEPGEQVDIWRPGEAGNDPRRGAMGSAPAPVINVHLSGQAFGQKAIRQLISELNVALGNGAQLQIA